jgi:hypothetical protein
MLQIKRPFLSANDDFRIQNYRHLSGGALSVLRAICKSRRQTAASSFGN